MAGKVLTANDLVDGVVVFLTADGGWSPWIDHAVIAVSEDEVAGLEREQAAAEAAGRVVSAYLVDVETREGCVRPLHIRERIRTRGPTVRRDLGKQAGASVHFCAAAE